MIFPVKFDFGESDKIARCAGAYKIHFPSNENSSITMLERSEMGKNDGEKQPVSYFTIEYGKNNGPTETAFKEYRETFLKIVPGDIIRYGNDHIGLIAAVDAVGMLEAKSIYELLECLKVTESTYGGDINNTFKRVSTDGAGENYVLDEKTYTKGSWFIDYSAPPLMRNFVIERLLSKE